MTSFARHTRDLRTTGGVLGWKAAATLNPSRRGGSAAKLLVVACNTLRIGHLSQDHAQGYGLVDKTNSHERWGYARFCSSFPGRWIYTSANASGLHAVAKVSHGIDAGLRREAEFLAQDGRLQGVLLPPVRLWRDEPHETVLTLSAVPGTPTFNARSAVAVCRQLAEAGITHGDFTPWNLLSDGDHLSLIDWETWSSTWIAYHDILSFLYKPAALLGRTSPELFLQDLLAEDSVLGLYERSLDIRGPDRVAGLHGYLEASTPEPSGHRARQFRNKLWEQIK